MHPLLSKEEILRNQRADFQVSGIYFLIDGDEIVYVGQARHIPTRIAEHWRSDKVFTSYFYIECDTADLSDLEAEYIVAFAPRYNAALPVNRKWTTLPLIRRYAREIGIGAFEVRRYMREHRVFSASNDFYLISDFNDLLGEGWR